jgi:predicted Zn-dependent protease
MRTSQIVCFGLIVCAPLLAETAPGSQAAKELASDPLVRLMAEELDYSMAHLATKDGAKPYYIGYTITDSRSVSVQGSLGAIVDQDEEHARTLDVDVRVGDYALDSTHQIRGRGGDRGFGGGFGSTSAVPIENDPLAVKEALWRATDRAFKSAVERFQRVQTDLKTTVDEEEKANDFSREQPSVDSESDGQLSIDRELWAGRIRSISKLAIDQPLIYGSHVALLGERDTRYQVTSEGTRLKTGSERWRLLVSASTKADDGMDLGQNYIFDSASPARLPTEEKAREEFDKVIRQVLALRKAPIVEPFSGPAILLNRASAVFFHEIFGHRIEGHRQKDVEEGQTFTKMVGHAVLPEFLTVIDDPTLARFKEEDLRGFYRYDDEGVRAQPVTLVENGVLKTFLMSRSPLSGFAESNGHGRREPGRPVVSRQGNLIVRSTKTVPYDELRKMLIEECRKQNKPFGYVFEDITGGFTTTSRGGPQAFKVLPVVVNRVYADGRPDELVRGVDIVGTPLSCFSKILATGDDPAVFNGTCGAESGWVPVSAVSPSILVEQIEIEKRERSQERLPILPPPSKSATGG